MEVEHFCRILAYSPDRLCLQMPHGRLTIYGDGLKIVTLTASRLTLRGRFRAPRTLRMTRRCPWNR